MVNAPINTGQDWEALRMELRKNIILKLNRILGEDLEQFIEIEEYMDPIKMEDMYSGMQGSIYGNSSNSKTSAFYRHPNFSSQIKGLYFAGVTVHPGGGIPLALNSAKIIEKCVKRDFKLH
jgi:phytoene dehydrogenase-like protein